MAPDPPQESDHQQVFLNTTDDWLAPTPMAEPLRPRRHTDVSQDPGYKIKAFTRKDDEECIAAPDRIPEWILPKEAIDALYKAGHGTAPDLIYARGIPNTPSRDLCAFDRKKVQPRPYRGQLRYVGTSDASPSCKRRQPSTHP